jgi:branched-subunit amino acid ABC-type transport system permease component
MSILQALVNGVAEGAILALAALGLTLVFGISRFPNAAHGDYLTCGAYSTYFGIAVLGLSMPLAALAGLVITIGVGLGCYYYVFRRLAKRSSAVNLIASIGIALFLRHAIVFVAGTQQYSYGLPILRAWRVAGLRIFPMDLFYVGMSLAAIAVVHLILRYTEIGRKMRAVADSPQLARVSGIRSGPVHITMWIMAMSLAALAGILLGMKTVVDPLLGWDVLLPAFAAAILGGFGSPGGAILGGLVIGVSQELAVVFISETYKVAVAFIVISAVLLIRPWGLLGQREVVR